MSMVLYIRSILHIWPLSPVSLLLNNAIKRHGIPGDKQALNTIRVSDADLNVILFPKPCCRIYWLSFPKDTPHRIEMIEAGNSIYLVNCF
jgi:hypothetical protein